MVREDAHISTYGGAPRPGSRFPTTQHWQFTYKGLFIMDTAVPEHLKVLEEMRDKLNGHRSLED